MLLITYKYLLCTHNQTIYVLRECQGPGLRNVQEVCGTSRPGIQGRRVKCQRCKSPGGTHVQGHANARSTSLQPWLWEAQSSWWIGSSLGPFEVQQD